MTYQLKISSINLWLADQSQNLAFWLVGQHQVFWGNFNTQYPTNPAIIYQVKIENGGNFGLKFHLSHLHLQVVFWNPSVRKEGHFCYWIWRFQQKSTFLWSKKKSEKGFVHGGISKIFFLDQFSSTHLTHIPFWPGKQRLNKWAIVC